jgi:hypothetical protein
MMKGGKADRPALIAATMELGSQRPDGQAIRILHLYSPLPLLLAV